MKNLLGIVLVLFAVPAFAADLNYNYVEFGYQVVDIDGASDDADGFGINGSFEVGENVFVTASYAQAEFDELGFEADIDTLSVGLGYHVGISDTVDFYGTLSWLQADVSVAGFGSADEDGFGATIGLRGMVGDNIELTGHLGYADLGDAGDGTTVGGGLLYNVSDNFSVGIFVDVDDDTTAYGGGIRLYW